MLASSFLSVDPISLARPDKDSMPQQTLMEILVGDFDDKQCFRDEKGDFYAACSWDGVKCTSDDEVYYIDWDLDPGLDLLGRDGPVHQGGLIDLHWIPSNVTKFSIPLLDLSGSIDTCSLPEKLVSLVINDNIFKGKFNIAELPRKLRKANVARNWLCGSLDLSRLPQSLEVFHASDNEFSGTIDLRSLPVSLQKFSLEGNHLSGFLDLRYLPRTIIYCHFGENDFQQDVVVFSSERTNIRYLALDNHKFGSFIDTNGEAVRMVRSSDKKTLKLAWH
ncbi:leucine-rich repeat protein [Perkinsela sp. CCAP 1560/4]|nr:leucine-rich repeat protein [Perkinsela sp. CCAP 1560/4]|eukprot:KNH02448.1 leucine-rich repeat protein [Perkinsela sp. CCAP 1560/4]